MIKATVKNKINFPQINFQEDLLYIGQRIFIPIMQKNIEDQVAIDGGAYPNLEPKTIARKQKLGQENKTLIATRELIESFYAASASRSSVVVALRYSRSAIGGYLQVSGIRTKKGLKFFKFFGINKQMENNAVAYMRNRVKEAIQNGR